MAPFPRVTVEAEEDDGAYPGVPEPGRVAPGGRAIGWPGQRQAHQVGHGVVGKPGSLGVVAPPLGRLGMSPAGLGDPDGERWDAVLRQLGELELVAVHTTVHDAIGWLEMGGVGRAVDQIDLERLLAGRP